MREYFRNMPPDKKLKTAAYLCIIAGIAMPLFIFLKPSDSSLRIRDFASALFHAGILFLAGIGVMKKWKWARYLGVFESIFAGGLMLIAAFNGILAIFLPIDIDIKIYSVFLIFLFVIVVSPGYVLSLSEVKNLFSAKAT